MSNRVLCKFFAHGACLKGEHCEFSHDWKDEANNICTFYQKGACSYGSRCRYYHAKSSRQPTSTALSANLLLMNQTSNTTLMVKDSSPSVISSSNLFLPTQTWTQHKGGNSIIDSESEDENDYTSGRPADIPICAFAAAGNCPKGEKCPHLHGDVCPTCGKHCLHPFRLNERDEHIRQCQKNSKHLEALRKSQEIECSVCLDRVLAKPTPAERKFGLLSECDHPFCISCIRNWRGSSPASGMDVNNVLRACPICRKVSYYVIPSVIWYSTKEEKQEIVDSYKSKLSSIDCKHFDFGNGNCPFGNSCFYKHVYRDGRREEVVLRHLGSQDGNMVIAKDVRLSDFFRSLHL